TAAGTTRRLAATSSKGSGTLRQGPVPQGRWVHSTTQTRKGKRMSVLKELLERRDAAHNEIKEISSLVHTEERELFDTEKKRVDELVTLRDQLDADIKKENKRVKRDDAIAEARKNVADVEERSSDDGVKAEVTSEPMVYGDGSPYSYFTDLARITAGHQWHYDPAATERMSLWAHQVEREFANDSEFGKKAV